MLPRTSGISAPVARSSRLRFSPRSKPTTYVPSSARVAQVHAPMHPRAPVTRKRSSAIARDPLTAPSEAARRTGPPWGRKAPSWNAIEEGVPCQCRHWAEIGAEPECGARSGVDVDGHDVRVELQRGAALLVRAEAAALDPAEGHVHLRAGGLRVHVDQPRLRLVLEARRSREIRGEDRGREPELDSVRALHRLVQVGEAIEGRHRAEDLLAREERVIADSLEDSRRDEVGLVAGALTAGEHLRALGLTARDRLHDLLELLLVDDRTDLGLRIGRVADLAAVDPGEEPLLERVVRLVLHVDPARSGALLACRPERARIGGLGRTVEAAYAGAFWSAGQKCTATRRIYVEAPVYDEFRQRLLDRIHSGKVGDPTDPETEVGPLVNEKQLNEVLEAVEQGKREGGTVLAGGERIDDDSYLMAPTLFEGVADDAMLSCEEVFGPVTSLYEFNTLDEAIDRANAVEFGLSASLFTNSLETTQEFVKRLEAGMLHVNSQTA